MITVLHTGFFSSLQTLLGWAPSPEDKCRNPRGSLSDEIIAEKHNKGKQGNIFKPSDFTVQLIVFLLWRLRPNRALQDAIYKCVKEGWTPSTRTVRVSGKSVLAKYVHADVTEPTLAGAMLWGPSSPFHPHIQTQGW